MRLAFITSEFVTEGYFSGGVANATYRIARGLVDAGNDVYVIAPSEIHPEDLTVDGIKVRRTYVDYLVHHKLLALTCNQLRLASQWLGFSWSAYKRVAKIHQKEALDIVQYPNSQGVGLATRLFLENVPQVVRVSCYRPVWDEISGADSSMDSEATEWLEDLQLRLSKNTYVPSYALQKILKDRANLSNVKVIRTPAYIETNDWDSSIYDKHLKGKQYLLFFGRLQLHKGFRVLAEAIPQVLRTYPDSYFVCVGIDSRTRVAKSMRKFAVTQAGKNAGRLIFVNQMPHEQLYPVIDGAKLVVLPSLVDNLPNTCLESMMLGKPVIGTIGTSFDEVITDGKDGFLVRPGDVEALEKKIVEVWNDPKLPNIGDAAKIKSKEFAPGKTIPKLQKYYESVRK